MDIRRKALSTCALLALCAGSAFGQVKSTGISLDFGPNVTSECSPAADLDSLVVDTNSDGIDDTVRVFGNLVANGTGASCSAWSLFATGSLLNDLTLAKQLKTTVRITATYTGGQLVLSSGRGSAYLTNAGGQQQWLSEGDDAVSIASGQTFTAEYVTGTSSFFANNGFWYFNANLQWIGASPTDTITITLGDATDSGVEVVMLGGSIPTAFNLSTPANASACQPRNPTFTWTGAEGVASYTLTVSPNADFSNPALVQSNITGTNFTPPADTLPAGQSYFWKVEAINPQGARIGTPESRTFDTICQPGAFDLISPAAGANCVGTEPTFTWQGAANADSYSLLVHVEGDPGNIYFTQSDITDTTLTLPPGSLDPNLSYQWSVVAVNASGSTNSSPASRTFNTICAPGAFALTAPDNAASLSSFVPTFEWGSASNATTYRLRVSTAADLSNALIDESGIGGTSFTVSGGILEPCVTYFWSVDAVNANGQTAASSGPRTLSIGPSASDYDGSTFVDVDDFVAFVADFSQGCIGVGDPVPSCTRNADVDGSGFVDSDDFSRFVLAFNCTL
ncbi:MAG: hypothetical protein SFY95_13010 [Planctomycetota bacterium]|nr:hypothetical protein [Planctomycetota bacterium]